jgi:hypothetical protein
MYGSFSKCESLSMYGLFSKNVSFVIKFSSV